MTVIPHPSNHHFPPPRPDLFIFNYGEVREGGGQWRTEKGIGSSGAGVKGNYEPPDMGAWELNLSSL